MASTVLITGANGSLSLNLVRRLLEDEPDLILLLTVRNDSSADANTEKLRQLVSQHDKARALIHQLDLASLSAVNSFAETIAKDISTKQLPPLLSIVCNAYYWNLTRPMERSQDGFEKTFQINHISHAALVLRLLNSFSPSAGRIVLFSSDAHYPKKNSLEKYPPSIPENAELLAKPSVDDPIDNFGRGFQRYANSKLAITTWSYALNRYLEEPKLSKITAVAVNPGNLSDSRALRTNTPPMLVWMSRLIIQPLRPLLRLMDPTMRTAAEAGADIALLATNKASSGQRGFFTLLKSDESSPESKGQSKQQLLWDLTLTWTKAASVGGNR